MSETIETSEPEVRRISSCTGCQQPLPLRLTRPGEKPVGWACSACGAAYSGVLDDSADIALFRNVRVSEKLFADSRSQPLPQGMMSFLGQLAAREIHDDRRVQKRFAVTMRATAIPVDEHLSPVGESFSAMTLNISQSGLALIHTRAVNDRFLLLELEDPQQTQVVIEVVRSRHIGRFYDIAGRFAMRFGSTAESS